MEAASEEQAGPGSREGSGQGHRQIAYLLCRDSGGFGLEHLRGALAEQFPAFADALAPLELPSLTGSGFGFLFAGTPFSCIAVPAALPRSEWEPGARANRAWPDAAAAVADHRAHVIIAPLAEAADRRDALRMAVACTVVAAALTPVVSASGICWYPAQTLIEPRAFAAMAGAMLSGGDLGTLPLDAWMRLEFGRMEGRYAARSHGLAALAGVDLMVVGDSPDPAAQGAVLYDVADYLIREQRSFTEGDTMDVGPVKLVARLAGGAPLVRLEPVSAVRRPC